MGKRWRQIGRFGLVLLVVSVALIDPPSGANATPSARQGGDDPPQQACAPGGCQTVLDGGRFVLSTPRGGSPDLGVAVARGLSLDGGDELGDFALAGDVRFEPAEGPAAATVRFRYRPEAGGGTGYLLSVDPFAGRVRLETFEEGQRDALVPWSFHPAAAVGLGSLRLLIVATGPTIAVAFDGHEVLRVADERYPTGLVALGVVTWSEPVTATFENVQVTIPAARP